MSGFAENSCASSLGSLKRWPSLFTRSASICDRIILTGCGPSGAVLGSVGSTAGAVSGVGSGALVVLDDVKEESMEGSDDRYLGPAVDGVVVVAAAPELPDNEKRFEPSFFLNTVFILDNNLPTPFFSSGPVSAGVLIFAIVELN